jgi:hypothetical protein
MSTLKAHNAYYGISGTEYLVSKSLQFHEIGRLAQLANLIQWLTSFFIDHRLVYKVYLISLNIAVGLLIRKITLQILGKNSRYYANIALLLFIVFGQIKNYYDPRTSIAGVCQFSIISFLFGLIFATRYLAKPSIYNISTFTFASVLGLYTYELNFFILLPVISFFYWIILIKNRSSLVMQRRVNLVSFWFVFFQYFFYLWTHYSSNSRQDDTTINYSWGEIKNTFLLQFFGSFPSKNFGSQKVFEPTFVSNKFQFLFMLFLILCLVSLILMGKEYIKGKYLYKKEYSCVEVKIRVLIIISCLSLIFIPALLTAFTLRFQRDVQAGLPYNGAYYLQVGLSIFLIFLFYLLRSQLIEVVVNSLLIAALYYFACLTFIVNSVVVNPKFPLNDNASLSQQVWGWERELIVDSAKSGLFDFNPEKNEFFFYPQYAWTSQEYLSYQSKALVKVLDAPRWWNNTANLPDLSCQVSKSCVNQFYVQAKGTSYSGGFLGLSSFGNLLDVDGRIYSSEWLIRFNPKLFIFDGLDCNNIVASLDTEIDGSSQISSLPMVKNDLDASRSYLIKLDSALDFPQLITCFKPIR